MKAKFSISLFVVFSLAAIGLMLSAWLPTPNKEQHTGVVAASMDLEEVVAESDLSVEQSNTPIISPTANTNSEPIAQTKVIMQGLTVELRTIDLNPDYPTITICADIPTVADWLPRFSAIYDGKEIPVTGWMLLDPNNNAARSKNRCYLATLDTQVFQSGTLSGQLTFSLDYFEMSLPERIPDEIIAKAQTVLKDSGIEFIIQDVSHGQNILVTGKPDALSQDEAMKNAQMAIEAATEKVYGPWDFTIDLK